MNFKAELTKMNHYIRISQKGNWVKVLEQNKWTFVGYSSTMIFFRVQEENRCLKIKVAHLVKSLANQEDSTVER